MIILLVIISCSKKDKKTNKQKWVDLTNRFVKGVDLSYVNQIEDHGGIYKDKGQVKDVFQIFKDKGANMVRLRLWNNPEWIHKVYGDSTILYSGFEDVKKSIKRAKSVGMAVDLDFHYSDFWADPEHQNVPEAWKNITDINVLEDSLYQFTYTILNCLYKDQLLPEMVQIGNETNCGFMITDVPDSFPKLSVCDGNWENFGRLLNAGIKAVRDMDAKSGYHTIIALHVADPKNLDWWYKGIINKAGVTDFDVAGFSYYSHFHKDIPFEKVPEVVKKLKSEIHKDIMILETGYAYTLENADSYSNIFGSDSELSGYPITIDGQKSYMIDLCKNMKAAGANGVMYWEPAWITSNMKDLWGKGSGWDNTTLFDSEGNATKAMDYLSEK